MNRLLTVTCLLVAANTGLKAQAGFHVDAERSSLQFQGTAAFKEVEGTFSKIEVESIEYLGYATSLKGRIGITINSLSTGKPVRDIHLKSSDFFDAERFPKAYIDVISVTEDQGSYFVHFALEIHGIRIEYQEPIDLKTTWNTIEAKGGVLINRTDFGIQGNLLTNTIIGNEIKLAYSIVLVR